MQRCLMLAGGLAAGAIVVVFAALALYVCAIGPGFARETRCPAGLVRASWYGAESGRRTASGRRFDGRQWLVAHKTLPFGTRLRLTYRGRSIVVPVEDRGPFVAGRTLDLSEAVARRLGTRQAGVPCIRMEILP